MSQNNKKFENVAQKYDISYRKFKNNESPEIVSKQLNGQYLRSYEQLSRKSDFKFDFEVKPEPIIGFTRLFLTTQKSKKVDQKM